MKIMIEITITRENSDMLRDNTLGLRTAQTGNINTSRLLFAAHMFQCS